MNNVKHIVISEQQLNQLLPIIKENISNKRKQIIDAIKNNSVVQIIYNYDHREGDKNKRYAKIIRPFVFGKSKGEGNKLMIRAYEYESFELDNERYVNDERPDLLGKNFKSYTTTENKKWKTYFAEQITFFDVLGKDDIDIPREFRPSYQKNDKLFSNIIYQKR